MKHESNQTGLFIVVGVLVVAFVMCQAVAMAKAGPLGTPDTPDFTSYGDLSFDDNTGCGWWGLTQYEDRATVNIGAYSTQRVISMQSGMTVDRYDPSMFSFHVSIRTLDGEIPTGRLNFQKWSSSGDNYLSAQVQDTLQDVYVGWDDVNQLPIYRAEMQAQFHADLFVNAQISSANDSFGHWTSEWYDGDGNLYFSQAGGEFRVDGYGTFVGSDPIATGNMMVASGAASFGNVPEPATMTLIGLGAIGLIRRRRQR